MVIALGLAMLAAAAMGQRPGWMGEDLLFDCSLARTTAPAEPASAEVRRHRYVIFLRGNRPEVTNDDEEYVPSLDVYDPDELLPFTPGSGAYGLRYAWPAMLSIELPAYEGRGPHQEVYPPRGFGGIFRPIRVDVAAGDAQVVLIQHAAWYGPNGEVPSSIHFSGHCRLIRGEAAYRTFQDITQ